jgi:uracil-DNA glycosylase family 4
MVSSLRVEAFGPTDAEFVIIGEAPGAQEMHEGRPFVGPSGSKLRRALTEVGLDPSVVYMTNVIKNYIPGNPTPTTADINRELPELISELISLPNAQYFLLVGNVALQALTGHRGGITKVQGSLLSPRRQAEALKDKKIMSVVHPAYVLRNENRETNAQFLSVLGAFKALGSDEPDIEIVWVGTAESWKLKEDLLTHDRAAIDLETTPFPWWHEEHFLISAAITFDGKKVYVLDLRRGRGAVVPPEILGGTDIKWEMHNGKFDRQVLLAQGIDLELGFDTMTAQYIIDPNQKKSLEFLSGIHLGLPPYKDVDYKNIENEPFEKIGTMNAIDASRTWRLYEEVYKPRISEDTRLNRLFQFLMLPAIDALLELELGGIPIDLDRLGDLEIELEDRKAELVEELRDMTKRPKLNPNSSKQMQQVLFTDLGLPVVKTTPKTGMPSLDKEVRAALMTHHPIIPLFEEYKTVGQRLSTFIRPWGNLQREGYLHTSYKPSHVVTGRLSSEKPNFQQVPREAAFRRLFGGVEDHKVIDLDYSQIELRIAAWLADETEMLRAYEMGVDLHTLTAELVIGDPKARQTGKTLNFALLYGAGPRKLQQIALADYGLEFSMKQAETYHSRFFDTYQGLRGWQAQTQAIARIQKYIDSPIGRRRYFPLIDSPDRGKAMHEERAALNHPVQSFASDLMLLSLTRIHQEGYTVLATIHDSVLLLAPSDVAQDVALEAKRIMERIPEEIYKKFGVDLTVPIEVDYTIGDYWYE